MLALNFTEICLMALWCIGVIAAVAGRRANGYSPRYFVIIAVALFVPVVGSVISLANLAMVRNDLKQMSKGRASEAH